MDLLFAFMGVLVVHFIADFVLQSNWMAQNKSHDAKALCAHCAVYLLCLLACAPFLAKYLAIQFTPAAALWALFNMVAHLLTDLVTSRINKRLWNAKRVHGFFVGIGADQLIHALTLGGSLAVLVTYR